MYSFKYLLFTLTVLSLTSIGCAFQLTGLEYLAHILNGDFFEYKPFGNKKLDVTKNMPSKGETQYSFLDFITYKDKTICLPYEEAAAREELRKAADNRKPLLKVKCIPENGNGTLYMINSVKEVITLLAPNGNSTKRNQEGSCVLMLFYTRSCLHSVLIGPVYNVLARQFPDIKIAAIDAFKFHALNTEFGIVGLPTVMLFHQGRPFAKFNETQATITNLIAFVTRYSGMKPISSVITVTSEDFNGPLPSKVEKDTDYWLYIAWIFIIICSCYYFSKSKLYTQIIEMIKRNWRESEAQHRS